MSADHSYVNYCTVAQGAKVRREDSTHTSSWPSVVHTLRRPRTLGVTPLPLSGCSECMGQPAHDCEEAGSNGDER